MSAGINERDLLSLRKQWVRQKRYSRCSLPRWTKNRNTAAFMKWDACRYGNTFWEKSNKPTASKWRKRNGIGSDRSTCTFVKFGTQSHIHAWSHASQLHTGSLTWEPHTASPGRRISLTVILAPLCYDSHCTPSSLATTTGSNMNRMCECLLLMSSFCCCLIFVDGNLELQVNFVPAS